MRQTSNPRGARGFSLIELLIVVAILGIIAGISIPNLIQSRQAACSASAVASLRLVHTSQASHRTTRGEYATLPTLGNEYFINDHALRSGYKSQYTFTVVPDAAEPSLAYVARATPTDPNSATIWRHYYVDASGVIRWRPAAPADVNDSVIN
jgi:prepilin-type N-terminal cleavage/methylation domain-containing protein